MISSRRGEVNKSSAPISSPVSFWCPRTLASGSYPPSRNSLKMPSSSARATPGIAAAAARAMPTRAKYELRIGPRSERKGRRIAVTVARAASECQQNDSTAARPCADSPGLKLNLKRENIAVRLCKPHNQPHALSGGLIVELRNLCVYCGSSDAVAPHFLEAAFSLGRLIGLAGLGLIYGGGRGGLVGRGADGVLTGGGRVTGIIPQHLSCREVAHGALTELIIVDSMHERKQRMAERADAFVILPGGFGTLDEMFEI